MIIMVHVYMYICMLHMYAPCNAVLRAESVSLEEEQEMYVFPEPGEAEELAVSNGSSAAISIPRQLLMDRAAGQHCSVVS